MSKGKVAALCFFIFLMGLFVGNFWRMTQESGIKCEAFNQGKIAIIQAIREEVPKGYVFWIDDLKFIPRQDGALNVLYPAKPVVIAGAGDQHSLSSSDNQK